MRRTLTIAIIATLAYSVVGAVQAGPAFNNKFSPDEVTVECNDSDGNKVGEITYAGPLVMWPPNHKQQLVSVTATAEDPEDMVTLDTEGTHDEIVEGEEMQGAGNTADDVDPATGMDGPNPGSASVEHNIRSERSGMGDGRTYTLDWQATFNDTDGDGGYGEVVCASAGFEGNEDAFEILVPHDMSCIHWNPNVSRPECE